WYTDHVGTDQHGVEVKLYTNAKGEVRVETYYWGKDENPLVTNYRIKGGGDPSPDDPSSKGTGIEPTNVAALIKAGLITYEIRANAEDTQLGQWIDRTGHGFVPHWNNDSDKGPGQTPKGNTGGGLTAKQVAEITKLVNLTAKSLASIGGSM